MYDGNASNGHSQPNRYINRLSSTIIVIFKALEGVAAGFVLYGIIRLMTPLFSAMAKGVLDLNQALQIIINEAGLPQSTMNELSGLTVKGIALPFIFWTGLIIVITVALLLVVIEAIALISLRTARKGAAFIRTIHYIYMGVWIVSLVLFGVSVFETFSNASSADYSSESARIAAFTMMAISFIIELISLVLNICYHKDIAMAMGTVAYEVETGRTGNLKKTHLSGISFFFGLPYAITILLYIAAFENVREYISVTFRDSMALALLIVGLPIILLVKHLSVCFCNRNLKKAR